MAKRTERVLQLIETAVIDLHGKGYHDLKVLQHLLHKRHRLTCDLDEIQGIVDNLKALELDL